jgi:hypothetical protein
MDGSIEQALKQPGQMVVERRPVEGRLVHILDPEALVARGEEVIENATL